MALLRKFWKPSENIFMNDNCRLWTRNELKDKDSRQVKRWDQEGICVSQEDLCSASLLHLAPVLSSLASSQYSQPGVERTVLHQKRKKMSTFGKGGWRERAWWSYLEHTQQLFVDLQLVETFDQKGVYPGGHFMYSSPLLSNVVQNQDPDGHHFLET